jgi:hypothetical protein
MPGIKCIRSICFFSFSGTTVRSFGSGNCRTSEFYWDIRVSRLQTLGDDECTTFIEHLDSTQDRLKCQTVYFTVFLRLSDSESRTLQLKLLQSIFDNFAAWSICHLCKQTKDGHRCSFSPKALNWTGFLRLSNPQHFSSVRPLN